MPIYRVTIAMAQANMGFTETWWSADDEAPIVADNINRLLMARAALLWTDHKFISVRIAQVGVRRKSVLLPAGERSWNPSGKQIIIPKQGTKTGEGVTTRPDQLRASLQLRVTYGGGFSALRYMSGIPDAISATEPVTDDLKGDPDWQKKFANYLGIIIGDGWQLNVLDPALPERQIRSITLQEAAPGLVGVGVLTGETIGVQPGDRVAIHGMTVNPCVANRRTLNATWVIDSVNTTLTTGQVVYFLKGTQGTDVTRFKFLGNIRKVGKAFADITAINVHRVGIHKRGKPLGSPVGRRKTRACLVG